MHYRPEVDGLRALAVVPVIAFHGGSGLASGGYVGVDVFFVISGYLITSLIAAGMDRGRFDLVDFYERRARRILPALFLVAAACAPFAWMYLTPREARAFSQSLVAVATFSSNFYFWLDSDYFSTAAELKPLLHTWSLGVEEQFYLLYPLFLMAAWRLGERRIVLLLAVAFAGSLALAQWGAVYAPSAAFYLLPTRAWELIAGALAAFHLRQGRRPPALEVRNLASLAGLVLIGAPVFLYGKDTAFPGLAALPPVLGAVLVILFADKGTLCQRMLAARPLVGIGLVSYSAYLWHQPLFAFARHEAVVVPPSTMALLAGATFVLAGLSWALIEQPFRRRALARGTLAKLATVAASLLVLLASAGYYTNGFERWIERKGLYALVTRDIDYDIPAGMFGDGECRRWVPDAAQFPTGLMARCAARFGGALVVLGDSHAMNVYNILARTGRFPFLLGVSQGGCRAHDGLRRCHYRSFDDFMKEHGGQVGGVLYHQSGAYFVEDADGQVDSQRAFGGAFGGFSERRILGVRSYLEGLQRANPGTQVAWLGPFLEYRYDPVAALSSTGASLEVNPRSVEIFAKLEGVIRRNVADATFARYVGFEEVFRVPREGIQGDCFVFRDKDHFSRCGEALLATRFLRDLDALAFPGVARAADTRP